MYANLDVHIVYLKVIKNPGDRRSFLSVEEISRLVTALPELCVCKIRLTGGEPTVVQGTCLSSKKPKS